MTLAVACDNTEIISNLCALGAFLATAAFAAFAFWLVLR